MTCKADSAAIARLIAPHKTNKVAITFLRVIPKIVHKKSNSPMMTIAVSNLMSFSIFDQSGGQKK